MTKNAMDRGLPFQLDDLWQDFALKPGPDDSALFKTPDFSLEPLQDQQTTEVPLIPDLDLEFPELAVGHDDVSAPQNDLALDQSPKLSQYEEPPNSHSDLWPFDLNLSDSPDGPTLRTWEIFAKAEATAVELSHYLSEAKSEAIDAALSLAGGCSGVLPQDTALRALCNLALGRSSVFFQWNETKRTFTPTLHDISMSSLSLPCYTSFVSRLVQYANIYRELQDWAEARHPSQLTPAVRALKQATLRILQAVETSVAIRFPTIHTILQLQQAIRLPHELLDHLCSLKEAASICTGEAQAISSISDCTHAFVAAGTSFTNVLRLLLEEVYAPWLEALCFELGLSDKIMSGSCAAPPEVSTLEDEPDLSLSTVDQECHHSSSTLLSLSDQALIQEAKASIKLVRLHMPERCLRCPTLDGIAPLSASSTDFPRVIGNPISNEGLNEINDLLMLNEASLLEAQPAASASHDALREAVSDIIGTDIPASPESPPNLEFGATQTAFDKLRPTIVIQARYLNRLVLEHIFNKCGLPKHLELQRSFHLFGSGDFVIRLSTALFSSETQTARRTRGVVPTGEVLGLRLGARDGQTWPPASSELRLTLNDVLVQSYRDVKPNRPGVPAEMPGALSFSIRELPDDEIDLVMDVSSLYALDFLRLQYTAPAPLNTIITSASLQWYDDVFRFLLKLLRVLDVTTRLRKRSLARRDSESASVDRFAIAAHDFICNLMSTLMEVGIQKPWRDFQTSMSRVERLLGSRLETKPAQDLEVGVAALRQMHEDCLEDIRSRLFLKRKQAKVRSALSDALAAVLQSCLRLEDSQPGLHNAGFCNAMSNALTILQAMADKPPKHHGSEHAEIEMARLLLARLNFNFAYSSGLQLRPQDQHGVAN